MTKTGQKDSILENAILLAETWLDRANALLTSEERDIQDQMSRLVQNPLDKLVLVKMIDQSFRAHDPERVADRINSILRTYGVPQFFSSFERLLVFMFLGVGRHLPHLSIPTIVGRMRQDSSRAIIPGEAGALLDYLERRKREGVRVNVNHLGEAVLGEEEALRRLQTYMEDLRNPHVECISVKISTLYSQISALAFKHTLGILKNRLSMLYRTAAAHRFERQDGSTRVPKLVYMDMEEYRDLEITLEAFMRTLDQEEFRDYNAGLALQAYVPDSYGMQQTLTAWARKRVAEGGSPVTLRLVKGANLEMERVDAAINNWPLAPYDTKQDVDANYKRMVDFGMEPGNIAAVHLGIASHNLFDLAYAFKRAEKNGVSPFFAFEMLEGMADHIRRAIQETHSNVLLYAPVAGKDQFIHAIAYLIRRLDENTGEENFLRHSFNLKASTRTWDLLREGFIASYGSRGRPKTTPNRVQDRGAETFPTDWGTYHRGEFTNEPDTDWSLAANRRWAESIRDRWMKDLDPTPIQTPLVVSGEEIVSGKEVWDSVDSNRIDEKIVLARYALATEEDVERAVAGARADLDGWRDKSYAERHRVLARVARELRSSRGDLIGAAAGSTGKTFVEGDSEVSEAIDFAEFYPFSARAVSDLKNLACRGKGVGLVISPWNFPISIPCGGIAAALAAGNTVIFKPSSNSVLVAWYLCRCFWRAGISKRTLQFVPCAGTDTGARLASHPGVDFIIFTGSTDTGLRILARRPDVLLAAETGGKNTTIITAMSDRDQAIRNVIHSAFSHGGQKCSATSLLILEKEVYEDESFKSHLVDAAKSFRTGSVWNFENRMGPLIKPPEGALSRAITQLEPGEEWALEPKMIGDHPSMWTPGVKWGVRPGSFTYMTELFGPVLGVMEAPDLDAALSLANGTGYGLTAAIESLDEQEQARWKERIEAGNLYINRGTTGAVVLRQPFGGMKKSALGAGIKAGGPNYVVQFMDMEEIAPPAVGAIRKGHPLLRLAQDWRRKLRWGQWHGLRVEIEKSVRAIMSYLYHGEQEFFQEKDYFHLRGQDNLLRYRPVGKVVVRVHPADTLFDTIGRIAAARVAGCEVTVSIPDDLQNEVITFLEEIEGKRLLGGSPLIRQTDEQLVKIMPRVQRFRYAAPDRVPMKVFQSAAERGFYIARDKVLMEGRIELLRYLREQSVCNNYHRYGNLGERSLP